jgi:hypothetical protein
MITFRNCFFVGLGALAVLASGCGSKGGSSGGSSASTAANTFPTGTTPVTSAATGIPGVSSLGTGRAYHTATALPSGAVFVAGGVDAAGTALTLTAIVTPTSVTQGPALINARYGHTATLLGNGSVLIAGGQSGSQTNSALSSTEIYDPASNTVIAGPNLSAARSNAVAVAFGPIGSQQVLIAGGSNGSTILGTAEVYNVNTNLMSTLQASLTQARSGASAGLMDDGTVIIVGGTSTLGLAGAEIFTPATGAGTFTATTMPTPVAGGAFASNGSEAVLAGGQNGTATFEQSTMVYELSTRVFSQGPLLSLARRDATASVVNGSQVVVIGGRSATGVVGNVEIFSGPTMATSTVSSGAPLMAARYGHTATVVGTNEILVIGGFDSQSTPMSSVEIVTAGGTTTAGSTVTPLAPAPLGVPMSITPVPSTSVIPATAANSNSTSSFLNGLLGSLLGNLLGTGTPQTAGLTPAITSITPTTGSAGTLVVVQATGIGAYLSVSFDNGSGTPVFMTSANCTAYQNGSSVQVSITLPATLPAGTYEIDLVTSSYSTAGSPAALAQTSFTVN